MPNSQYVWARNDDPKCEEWESDGYLLVGESWGAHLSLDTDKPLTKYSAKLDKVKSNGFDIREVTTSEAKDVSNLERVNNKDYPFTPATEHPLPALHEIEEVIGGKGIIFGAFFDEDLVGVLATKRADTKVEFEFASILEKYRGLGLAGALGSMAILVYIAEGVSDFATGGAAVNESSKGTVESLGFTIDEIWKSYKKPD